MKISRALYSTILVLLLFFSGSPTTLVRAHGAHAARIPEHTCHKQISLHKCHQEKCFRECSKEPYGNGECRGRLCVCTYYCQFPPL